MSENSSNEPTEDGEWMEQEVRTLTDGESRDGDETELSTRRQHELQSAHTLSIPQLAHRPTTRINGDSAPCDERSFANDQVQPMGTDCCTAQNNVMARLSRDKTKCAASPCSKVPSFKDQAKSVEHQQKRRGTGIAAKRGDAFSSSAN